MKTKIIAILSFLLICSSSFTHKDSKPHFVGENFGGGIVFYVEKNGNHGLISSLYDVATEVPLLTPLYGEIPHTVNYSKNKNVVPEPSSSKVRFKTNEWNGYSNTNMFLKAGYDPSAASVCKKHNGGNYSSWYLPSVKELEILILHKETIDSILNNDNDPSTQGLSDSYWSSSYSQGSFMTWAFQNEIKRVIVRDNYLNVRAIRKF
jgi:hypothetical protein